MRLLTTRTTKPGAADADVAGDAGPRAPVRDRPSDTDRLFERYGEAVLTYCYYRLGTWEEAEDAAQHVFLNAFSSLHRFRDQGHGTGGSLRSWLFTIAHHEVANRRRAHSRHPAAPLEAAIDVADPGPTPEERAVAADHQGRVLGLISQLSRDQRRVVELRLAGLTDAEIAAALGRSHGAIRATQCRALARLRGLMGIGPSTKGGDDA
jgi:RNA polymerase sigma-70 factor (ECF subfamily)